LPGVAFESVTVQFTVAGVVTLDGVHATDCNTAGATSVSPVVTIAPFNVAETFAVDSAVNAPALAVNVALEAPCATVTDAGTVNCELSLASAIAVALVADEDSVVVQLALALGPSDVGVHTMLDRATGTEAGFRVTDAAFDTPLDDAVTCAVTVALTDEAVAVNAAEEPLAGMVTDDGTVS